MQTAAGFVIQTCSPLFPPFSKKWYINELKVLSCDHLPHCPVQLAPVELRNSRLARQLGSVFGTWTQLLWKRFVYTNSVRSFRFSLQLQAHLFCNHLPSCTDIRKRKRRACSFMFLEEHKSSSMCFFPNLLFTLSLKKCEVRKHSLSLRSSFK